jgi:hypothetical protein
MHTHTHDGEPCPLEQMGAVCLDTLVPRWIDRVCGAVTVGLVLILMWSLTH